MTWFTFLTGLIVFGIGAGCKFLIPLREWQALLPLVLGLGYLTLAEGMRSQIRKRRLFAFLAILWSIVVLMAMLPLAREGLNAWGADAQVVEAKPMRAELVMEHAGVLVVSAVYLLVAVVVFVRWKPVEPVKQHGLHAGRSHYANGSGEPPMGGPLNEP